MIIIIIFYCIVKDIGLERLKDFLLEKGRFF